MSRMPSFPSTRLSLRRQLAAAAPAVGLVAAALIASSAGSAGAADAKVGLGTASSFAILAGSTVTNTGQSVISGNIGLTPGSSITGFPPAVEINGSKHISDAVARTAKRDLVNAYDDAAGRRTAADVTSKDLGGMTLTPGVYQASTSMALTGTLTLNAQGNSAAVFIFKAGSTLVTASQSRVRFVNGGSPCNVFWKVGSSATLGTGTRFIGTILALTSASLSTAASVQGRVLARNGAVTLDTNVVTAPNCASTPPPVSPSSSPSAAATQTTILTGISSSSTPSPTGTPNGRKPKYPRIPRGHPHTGLGGSQGSADGTLLVLGGLGGAAAAAIGALGLCRPAKRRG